MPPCMRRLVLTSALSSSPRKRRTKAPAPESLLIVRKPGRVGECQPEPKRPQNRLLEAHRGILNRPRLPRKSSPPRIDAGHPANSVKASTAHDTGIGLTNCYLIIAFTSLYCIDRHNLV